MNSNMTLIFDMGFQSLKTFINATSDPAVKDLKFFSCYLQKYMNQDSIPFVMGLDISVFDKMQAENLTYLEGGSIMNNYQGF